MLPKKTLHGTLWALFDSVKDKGLIPGSQLRQGKGGGRGRGGRQHVHFIFPADRDRPGGSGMRENSTMMIEVDPAQAVRHGVRFCASKNGVILTSDAVPPSCVTCYQSLKTWKRYDRDGNPL